MSICPRCETSFECCMERASAASDTTPATSITCWCFAMPASSIRPVREISAEARCFCPACLPDWQKEQEIPQQILKESSGIDEAPASSS